jgi:hypothetical protein
MKLFKILCWFGAQAQMVNIAAKNSDDAVNYCMNNLHGIQNASLFAVHEYIIADFILE